MARKLIAPLLVVTFCALAFAAWPFWSAWTLREAIKNGDTATLERRIEWDSVRASLRQSLARNAQLLPEVNAAGEAIKPTLWQRVKTALGQSMLDRFIENYVTPEGLPKLFSYRKTYREKVKGEPAETTLAWHERFKRFWSRVHRAEFQSLTRIEIEMTDKDNPERRYASLLELQGLEWRLIGLRVITPTTSTAEAPSARDLDLPPLRFR